KPHQSGGYGVGPVAGGRRCGRATAVRLVTMQLRPPPDRSHSTRVRWRLFRPWIEKPCSRVLRKLSGELTTIQYCAVRPPPDFRLRLPRPCLAGRCCSVDACSTCSACSTASTCSSSDTSRRLL